MWLLLLIVGMVVLYLLPAALYKKHWNKGLKVRIDFEEPYIFEGDESYLIEEITNDKYLPLLALAVRLSVSKNLRFSGSAQQNTAISDQTYKRDIFSLPFFAKVTRRLPFHALKRGYYEITSIDITSYDHFLADGYRMEVPEHSSIYVYPKAVDISRIQTVNVALSGLILTKRLIMPDPFTFAGIREYMRDDSMSQINWKASAKGNELLVNQYDATTSEDITILIDLSDKNILKEYELIEETIRIGASLCDSLISRRMRVRIISNAPALNYDIKAGAGNGDDIQRAFAVVDADNVMGEFTELIHEETASEPSDLIYIVISKNASKELRQELDALRRGGRNEYLWVLPFSTAHPERANAYISKNCIGWEV